MVEVDDLFPGTACATRLLFSRAVTEAIAEYAGKNKRHGGQLLSRLQMYAKNGFHLFEGEKRPIRPEWGGVYRIGHPVDLFRIIGFYADGSRGSFVAIDAFVKRGHGLGASERRRIDAVAAVKKNRLWLRRTDSGDYPRLAGGT
jgi:hypothetical protein